MTLDFGGALLTVLLAGVVGVGTHSTAGRAYGPFSADFEEVRRHLQGDSQGPIRRVGKIYRNRDGWVRQDLTLLGLPTGPLTLTTVIDPTGQIVTRSRSDAPQSFEQMAPPPEMARALSGRPGLNGTDAPTSDEEFSVEDLGTRVIEGLTCGGRKVRQGVRVTETWTCIETRGQPILVSSKTPHEEYLLRLYNVRIEDPDPSLFSLK
jgi:hypothetical protein